MVNYFSPGVYTTEKDVSNYPAPVNSSVVGIVGFASKGPVNEATLITSPNQLIDTFGEPSEDIDGQGLEGALEILEATNAIYFVRAATDTALEASAMMSIGTCPAVEISGGNFGYTQNLYLRVMVADQAGTQQFTEAKNYAIPAGMYTTNEGLNGFTPQVLALQKVIGGSIDTDKVGFTALSQSGFSTLYGAYAGSTAYIEVSAYSDATYSTPIAAIRPLFLSGILGYGNFAPTSIDPNLYATAAGYASAVRVYGGSIPTPYQHTNGVGYYVESLYPGAGYNLSTKADGTVIGNSVETDSLGNQNSRFTVNNKGTAAENFKVSLCSGTFIEDVINVGNTNTTSEYIKGFFVSGTALEDFTAEPMVRDGELDAFASRITELGLNTTTPIVYGGARYLSGTNVLAQPIYKGEFSVSTTARLGKFIEATQSLAGGDNGIGTDDENDAAIIGSPAVTPKSGMYALDRDDLNISIALTPGKNSKDVQNALITLAESSQNFLALVAPPYGSIDTPQEAIDWSNGRNETRNSAINSSYAAVYWPWVKVFSVFDGIDRWYDPTIFAARQMCFTDSISDPWFAPAGFRRGRLTKPTEVEVNLNQGDRDAMYSGGNIINPIVSFPQNGITIFGQRTAQRTTTAMDRVNVRRLMIFLRKAILNSTQSFVFEPNDAFTWESVKNSVAPLLEDIRQRRGIVSYSVVCDETTNTPIRVDRNELWCKVVIQPTKAAEVVVFEINVTNQAAKIGG